MNGTFSASEVLGAMITPAVLISASGTLVLSTSNRLSRVVDRVRVLTAEAEQLQQGTGGERGTRMRLISDQLARASKRVLLLRSALTVFYSAIGLLVATSIAIGLVAALRWSYGWVPVTIGLCGACALLYGTLLLVREGRLAVGSTLQELSYAQEVVGRERSSHSLRRLFSGSGGFFYCFFPSNIVFSRQTMFKRKKHCLKVPTHCFLASNIV
jgi:MFS family permease